MSAAFFTRLAQWALTAAALSACAAGGGETRRMQRDPAVIARPGPPLARIPVQKPQRAIAIPAAKGVELLSFADLRGWVQGDHVPAFLSLRTACADIDAPAREPIGRNALFGTGDDWSAICRSAASTSETEARAFFEDWFAPISLEGAGAGEALFTGYYEPEIEGSRQRGGPYQHPIYAKPDDLRQNDPRFSREAIQRGALNRRGLELFWLKDPTEAFFLQIQGSGRIRLPDGSAARVGYAAKNGFPYRSIGRTLIEWGEADLDRTSMPFIKDWVAKNPARREQLFATNPSFVFFTERTGAIADPTVGPIGAFGIPLPANRSVAIDPEYYSYGTPLWVSFDTSAGPMRRLAIALDTGSAIKGPRRADFFFGAGEAAGVLAGTLRSEGRLIGFAPRAAINRIGTGTS